MTGDRAALAAGRVIARCREIAAYTEVPGETNRPFLCESARAVQGLVRGWMEQAGMGTAIDDAGNLRGLYAGTGGGRLLLGSHLDTVPNAGAFDGILGVVLAIAVVEELRGERLPYALEVLAFSEEEGVRFGRPFLGSMALTGRLDAAVLALRDRSGITVEGALRGFGLDPSRLDAAVADAGAIGFLEIHIEQGPVLEGRRQPLGVVSAIMGQTRLLLTFRGRSNHAGTTPMELRRDPVAAAAEWISAVEAKARATDGLVATVGQIEASPGAANVIAASLAASLDVRHAVDAIRAGAVQDLLAHAQESGRRRCVSVEVTTILEQAAVGMSASMASLLERAAEHGGQEAAPMTSGAGHDAMVLAERMPSAMLFVRSPGGISHHPEENVLPSDVGAAIETVMRFLMLLGDGRLERSWSHA